MNPEKIKSKSYYMIKARDEWTTVLGGPKIYWEEVGFVKSHLRAKRIVDKIKKIFHDRTEK